MNSSPLDFGFQILTYSGGQGLISNSSVFRFQKIMYLGEMCTLFMEYRHFLQGMVTTISMDIFFGVWTFLAGCGHYSKC